MSFFNGAGDLDLFLGRARIMSISLVPVCLALMIFFISEEGWRFSLLLCCILPPIGAYLAFRGHREIRAGLAAIGLVLAVGTLPLAFGLALLEGA
ncbi:MULTISPECIES: hypothetical protein [Streptomyces]|uniref:hypothetical protein n=1 Tax=Streptomyces TaxID=1883 RepID=UPI000D528B42|nr:MULTISPECIES: hypothetical protein [Streptomyces]AWE52760.1 hypothetical protein DC008_25750 [Streptomyces nigra]MCF2539703.1 hypothetical protein [Streptomyces sp. FB2]